MTLRLNLGAGDTHIPGFEPRDIKRGQQIHPLPDGDGSVAEIRASHVLEHFGHREVPAVLADWVRALKPGGLLRVAVPDFQLITEQYHAGAALPTESLLMGGQVDEHDVHRSIFDEESLTILLQQAGLLGVCRWTSEIDDCAAYPISLNLQGWKAPAVWPRISAVTSVPRLGFTTMRTCAFQALAPLGIQMRDVEGAFWGQCLTRGIEVALEQDRPDYILTLDYDSIFTRQDVECLISAAMRHPEADAIAPVQAHRNEARQLFVAEGPDGEVLSEVTVDAFKAELLKVSSAHFGLTLFRADALRNLPRPWFWGQPDPSGGWGSDRTDDDVWFWQQWRQAGHSVYLANRVPIGHLELQIRWPDRELGVMHQSVPAFKQDGRPENSWR